jgi:hypothetical protein
MNSFQSYDTFRLKKFLKRKPTIEVGDKLGFSYYLFDEVDYFNYVFFSSKEYNAAELSEVFLKYKKIEKNVVKIIFPLGEVFNYRKLIDFSSTVKEIVCLERQILNGECISKVESVLRKVNDKEEVYSFTKIYLEGFGSEVKDVLEVTKNFCLLFESKKVDFYFIIQKKKIAGVCVNYYEKKHVLLAACTIRKAYRNCGLQKKAIDERVFLGREKGYESFSCWAYKGGISHQNLLKSKFFNYSVYEECISKPLDELVKN